MYKPPPNPILKLLTPRVFFYLFLTLVTAWLMYRHGQRLEAVGSSVADPYVVKPRPDLPFKESEMTSPTARKKPMLILIGGGEDKLAELRQALEAEFSEACSIIQLDTGKDAAALEFFRVSKTPAALLFDADNQELARNDEAIDSEPLKAWLKKQLPE